jgi:hypothetical protein
MKTIFSLVIFLFVFSFAFHTLNSQILLEDPVTPVDSYSPILLNEGFNTPGFPPLGWSTQVISGSNWIRNSVSANCLGTGSAVFTFFTANTGDQARLISPNYSVTGLQDTLMFFNAYAPFPGIVDTMKIYTSTNGGSVWSLLHTFTAEMITAPPTGSSFTPSCNQWAKRTLMLPLNTNRIFFEGICSHGNNLYIDSIVVVGPYPPIGIKRIDDKIPTGFKLQQNYPNPFNPTTRIRFDIPSNEQRTTNNVQLIVYDVLGHEIAVLVNEELKPGSYEVDWNASDYPSGVYYYKLSVRQAGSSTGDFTETKKIILTK